MKRGFTLLELLIVVAIMGLLGTTAVGGYRQMQRGMEERRVVDNATKFLSLAADRARIDGYKVIVSYWNEMLREETEDETPIIIGRAVAVRYRGRITRVSSGLLIDEYGDLEQYNGDGTYVDTDEEDSSNYQKTRLYPMDGSNHDPILVKPPKMTEQTEIYLSGAVAGTHFQGLSSDDGDDGGVLLQFGYDAQGNSGAFRQGMAYGMEFQEIRLPQGYLFGGDRPTSMANPVSSRRALEFNPKSPTGSLSIYALRQGSSGNLDAKSIGTASVETN